MQSIVHFRLAARDLLTRRMLALASVPFVVSIVVLGLLYGGLMVWLYGLLFGITPAESLPEWMRVIAMTPVVGTTLREFFLFAIGLVISVIGFFLVSQMIVVTAILITGFFTRPIAKLVHQRHYSDLPMQKHDRVWRVFGAMLLRVLGYGLLVLVCLPLLLVPLLGVLLVNGILLLLFRSLLMIDVGSNIFDESGYRALVIRRGGAWSEFLLLYLLSLVPLLNLLVPVYAVIVTTHLLFRRQAAARSGAAEFLDGTDTPQ